MTNQIDKRIEQATHREADTEWTINSVRRETLADFEPLLTIPMWKRMITPAVWFLIGCASIGVAVVGSINTGNPQDWGFFYFAGIITIIAIASACDRAANKRDAPRVVEQAKAKIRRAEADRDQARQDLAALREQKQTLATDSRWLTKKLTDLASTAGFSDGDVARMRGVLDATRDAIVS